ncbi:BspA family leucine-rich repeat surface protein [Maribacter sp. MAR_2009_72]|uniref:BspA family leucine-rich repeat surface protein n=1 Tax=Maribacter sp. MAR_2009_72 TaxID=1250050 RepID=UPI00119B659D|nr:BspA family leucine-rich repeat surface protein [Maribacter sp. MAR_2009_72]TVZ14962.1 putative secreted protein (Por secretion system target) [Maribacter sp. MAR_2009_72]
MKNSYNILLFLFFHVLFVSSLFSQQCDDHLINDNTQLTLQHGVLEAGGDNVLGTSLYTNNSDCAVEIINQDNGQPWARYHIELRLADLGLVAGDELYIGIDGRNNTGAGRIEVNLDDRANSAIFAHNFTNTWSRAESTFVIPDVETIDIWLFSNYTRNTPGTVFYDNLLIEKVETFRPFITTWKTDNSGVSANNQITIPTFPGENYDYTVDWGDGTRSTNVAGDITHTYQNAGTYSVAIYGDFPRIYFNGILDVSKDFNKLLSVDQWGDIEWSSMSSAFDGCRNMSMLSEDVPNLTSVTHLNNMFVSCTSLVDNPSWNNWDTGNILNMNGMFFFSNFNSNISNWDVSNVASMDAMFNLSSFNQDIGNWNVESLRTMNEMFKDTPFNQNISTWDMQNVERMKDVFRNGSFDQDISDWNIAKLKDASGIFDNSSFSTANYDLLLSVWSLRSDLQPNVLLGAVNINYCIGGDARQRLIDTYNWNITDAGEKCPIDFTNAFVTTWKTDNEGVSGPNQISIPTGPYYNYNYTIDWGDGSISEQVTGSIKHTYENPGTYTVSIVGQFPQIYFNSTFNNISDSKKILLVNQWGDIQWQSMQNAFAGCANLDVTATDVPDLTFVRNMSGMFAGAQSLVYNSSINNWDTSSVINMVELFFQAKKFNQPISNWNVEHVQEMTNMFAYADVFNQEIGTWDTSNVIFMTSMFAEAKAFNQNIGNWNTVNVYSMDNLFAGAESFNQDIGDWNLENVIQMGSIFYNARSFDQDINRWDVSKVTNLSTAFYFASSFNQDVSNWDISNVEYMYNMFDYSGLSTENYDAALISWSQLPELKNEVNLGAYQISFCAGEEARQFLIDTYSWSFNDKGLARNCGLEEQIPFVTTWKTDNSGVSNDNQITIPTYISQSWEEKLIYDYTVDWGDGTNDTNVTGDITHTYETPGIYTVSISGDFPRIYFGGWDVERDSQKILTVEQWGNYGWSSMNGAFINCSNLDVVAEDVPNLTWVKSLTTMFQGCTSLVGNSYFDDWNTQNIDEMTAVFAHALQFNQPLDSWNVSNVRYFYDMFAGAANFNQPVASWNLQSAIGISGMFKESNFNQDISNWNVSNVQQMALLFAYNTSFNQDISTWDVSNVEGMYSMFLNASSFNQDISNWQVQNVRDMSYMFSNAINFNQDLGSWNVGKVMYMDSIFDDSGITNENYDNILNGWYKLPNLRSGVELGANDKFYCNSAQARAGLAALYDWEIVDSGKSQDCDISDFRPFVTTWNVSENNNPSYEITIPTFNNVENGNSFNYDYDIDWGDGSTNTNVTGTISHNYAQAGEYIVSISRNFPGIYFEEDDVIANKIQSIDQWGDIRWEFMQGAFAGCTNLNLSARDTPDLSLVTSTGSMFENCSSLIGNSSFNKWNMSSVQKADKMFEGAILFNQILRDWDTSQITDMSAMFKNSGFKNSLGTWDVGQVTTMNQMFEGSQLTTVNYDNTLVGWSRLQSLQPNVQFNAGLSSYCLGESAKRVLVENFDWTISDNGKSCPEQNAFVSTWKTDNLGMTDNNQISLPIWGGPYTVDWGDGIITDNLYGEQIHTYELAGTYTVSISGTVESINFRSYPGNESNSDATKILAVNQWGDIVWQYAAFAFSGCTNLDILATDAPNLSQVQSLQNMFASCSNLKGNESFNDWDVSNIINLESMFTNCKNFNANISNWDVSNVTFMNYLFSNNTIFNQDISNWEVSNVTLMNSMFGGASTFNHSIDNWNVSNVTDMSFMFHSAQSFNQPLSSWDVGNVTKMTAMFESSNFNQDISNWNVSNVTEMTSMFGNVRSFNQDLSGWDVSNVTKMQYMFGYTSFDQDLSSWNVSNVTDMANMFDGSDLSIENYDKTLIGWSMLADLRHNVFLGTNQYYCASKEARQYLIDNFGWHITDAGEKCPIDFSNAFVTTWNTDNPGVSANTQITIPTSDIGGYNYSVDWGDGIIESGFTGDATHTYSNAGTYTVSIIGDFPSIVFNGAGDKDKLEYIVQWGDNTWSSMAEAFKGCTNLDVTATDIPDVSNVTSFGEMFSGCSSLIGNESFNSWNVSNGRTMLGMFYGTTKFNQPLSNWDVSNVLEMIGMFRESGFNQDISAWNVSKVERMNSMFKEAADFNQSLGEWSLNSITNMDGMLDDSGLSIENYDATLIGWKNGPTLQGITLGAANISFCTSAMERQELIDGNGWIINDAGEDCPIIACSDNLENEDEAIILPVGTIALGVDSVTGVTFDTNNSNCAIEVRNLDNNQPWGTYRIAINLSDYGIDAGDELFIGVDGKSVTGTARMEINPNNSPNAPLGSMTFGTNWSRYETTFTVPANIASIDLWFFSNYAQSIAGTSLYDNLTVINLSDNDENLLPIANADNDITQEDSDMDGSETLMLDGTNSVDLDGEIVSYSWSLNESEIAVGENPIVTFNIGEHEVVLTVTDNLGATAMDTVLVNVFETLNTTCSNDLFNEHAAIVLPSGTTALGVDTVAGTSDDTNGSSCALEVGNMDSGQPWGTYRIKIKLDEYGIVAGDELFIGVDGKSVSGTARLEINPDNRANSALGANTFGNEWSRYETTIMVPQDIESIDLWFFSNYAQQNAGNALYDNLEVINLSSGNSGKSYTETKSENSLAIYPNPASVETTLSFTKPTTVGTIQIFDVTGRLVRTIKGGLIDQQGTPVNVLEIPTGTYFVKTTDVSGLEFQQQMLIQRQ